MSNETQTQPVQRPVVAVKPSITPRHRQALATAVNGVLDQTWSLDRPRGHVTPEDAGLIYSIISLLLQVTPLALSNGAPTVEMTATQTHGHSASTKGAKAVADALENIDDAA